MRADGAVSPTRVEGTFQPQARLQPAVGEAPRARALAVLLVEEGDDAPVAVAPHQLRGLEDAGDGAAGHGRRVDEQLGGGIWGGGASPEVGEARREGGGGEGRGAAAGGAVRAVAEDRPARGRGRAPAAW